jgi:hypothetical protein
MGSPKYRVTKAQCAAVCALVLAGQTFSGACAIVDAPWRYLREFVPRDWSKNQRRPHKWRGDLLKEMEEAYRDPNLRVDTIAAMFGIGRRQVASLAAKHGWPRRRGVSNIHPALPVPIRAMTTKQLTSYRKLRAVLGRSAAEQAVFGGS